MPPNLQVVGIRLIDENDQTVEPWLPGLAQNGTVVSANSWAGVPCSGGTCPPPDGGIAQLYHDTGLFFSTDSRTARNPSDDLITLNNGILIADPAVIGGDSNLRAALGVSSPFYAHNQWDAIQVELFGAQGGNTPHLFGSPVAGPETHYRYEATEVSGTPGLHYNTGPWNRIVYPGSLIATGGPATSRNGDGMDRYVADASGMGWDLTPNNALPVGTNAIRIATGAVRGGRPVEVEIAFRVLATPLDPGYGTSGGDVDCTEAWGGDIAGSPTGGDASNNPWGLYAPTPGCVFLNLLFDITADEVVRDNAEGQNDMTFTIRARNLSLNPRNNVWIRQKYNPMRLSLSDDVGVSVFPDMAPTCSIGNCDGDGFNCIYWSIGTLNPSDEVTIRSNLEVSNGGDPTTPVRAGFTSDDLGVVTGDPCATGSITPGHVTQETVQIRSLGVIDAQLTTTTASASSPGTADITGTFDVEGTQGLTANDFWLTLPAGWTAADTGGTSTPDITIGGTRYDCDVGCSTNTPRFEGINESMAAGDIRTISFRVNVPAGTSAGNYPVDLHIVTGQTGYGGRKEFVFNDATLVPVGGERSDPPLLDCPILSTQTSIPGTTTEDDGTIIRVYFNGIQRAEDTAASNAFDAVDSPGSATPWAGASGTFGTLWGGLEVRATAQAPGENESPLSTPCFVTSASECSDGFDNDGDGLADFPADPGCSSLTDRDETDVACSDGVDNDGDGDTDWPDDLECTGPDGTTEGGPPQCNDGLDNDGDGTADTADPCCVDAMDRTEACFRECNDLVDNDGDMFVDFGDDAGCHAVNDDDETTLASSGGVNAQLLFVFDTSGSMNWNTCADDFTGGDGSVECGGNDISCAECSASGCGDGLPNDSRIDKAKRGLSNVVAAYGEVEWGLMRFHQRPMEFQCPTSNASAQSGGWQGAGAAPCGGGFNSGDLLVGFGTENQYDLLEWMDGRSNYPGGSPSPGMDLELRGSGTTPIAGSLDSARAVLTSAEGADPVAGCRPYRVILVTDGQETCGGNPVTAAGDLLSAGYPVYVIGFAVDDPAAVSDLNAIASAGGTTSAIFVSDETTLSAAIADIVSDTVLVEDCNGADDDCDSLVDEGFTLYCDRPSGVTSPSLCTDPGETDCDGMDDNCNGLVDEGVLNACGLCGPTPTEGCDRVDNDCDGAIDEGDVCDGCVPEPEVCDGFDNDCDDLTDESLTRVCGTDVGACSSGFETCTAGSWGGCTATGGSAETCDGVDNDCDGVIDGITRPCGSDVGACSTGSETCTGGSWGSCVGEIGPGTEACNLIDDDCDGVVDDGNPDGGGPCGSSIGECSPGSYVCTGGVLVCSGGTGPVAESCDSLDNDCDGTVDEEVPTGGSCGSTTGECQAGVLTCSGGMFVCTGAQGPTPEICDGLDNDCDGTADEGNPGGGADCGSDVGECVPGSLECTGGVLVCTGGTSPIAEACDGLDNDCDTSVDEEVPTDGPCGSDVGECRQGVRQCMGGSYVCTGERGPTTELCDGLDNDCDGTADDGNPGGGDVCGTTEGECDTGLTECVSGSLTCVGETGPGSELCDSLDNDCDSLIDEGNPEGGAACGSTDVGECEFGAETCVSGSLTCVGASGPTTELCDGLDNDCDGMTDEGNPEGGAACGDDTGACEPGVTNCVSGSLICEGSVGPTDEVCNAIDDDCDGVVDDGIPVGAPCGTDEGECVPGVNVCIGGSIVCEGGLGPVDETCNALDDDCDGSIDEGLGAGAACGTDEGECMAGTVQCVGGREICVGEVPPAREGCDCLDNDCDGTVDEEPSVGTLCPSGTECIDCSCASPCVISEFAPPCAEGLVPIDRDGECWCVPGEECVEMDCALETVEVDGTVMCAPDMSGVPECTCKSPTECTFPCSGVTCADGTVCKPDTGRCVPDNCRGLGCPAGEICDWDTGECGPDPCVDAGCAADEACRLGTCEPSCADASCAADERCVSGECVEDLCHMATCAAGEICNPADGTCVDDMCTGSCPDMEDCDPVSGDCEPDPCLFLHCPEGQICRRGECELDEPTLPDAGPMPEMDGGTGPMTDSGSGGRRDAGEPVDDEFRVLATGGGGCLCSAPGADGERSTGSPWWSGLVGLLVIARLVRRRRSR